MLCPKCNKRELDLNKDGSPKYCCKRCRKTSKNSKKNQRLAQEIARRPYIIYRKDSCDFCGFVPVHICQLDVDHIDGNHDNNDPSNLQTLCANCHRLKTHIQRWGI
jgi:hypothetical protein